MAITVIELRDKLNAVSEDMFRDQEFIMEKLAMDALSAIKTRVIEKGEMASGGKFPAYSTKPMLANRGSFKTGAAYNKIAGSKKKRKELKWVTIGGSSGFASYLAVSSGTSKGDVNEGKGATLFEIPGGYKQFRELHGRPTGHVDFSFTNEMWNDITLKSSVEDHRSGLAVIGAVEALQKKKLAGNTERKGEILALSQTEINDLVRTYDEMIENIFRKNGLAPT